MELIEIHKSEFKMFNELVDKKPLQFMTYGYTYRMPSI